MGKAHIDLDWAAFEAILHGDGARAATKKLGNQLAGKWRRNIHRLTGVTRAMISVDAPGGVDGSRTYVQTGEAGPRAHERVNLSAEMWLEYGTSKMTAQAPGRTALGEMAAE